MHPSRAIVFNNACVHAFKQGYYDEALDIVQGAIQTLYLWSTIKNRQNMTQSNATKTISQRHSSNLYQPIMRANELVGRFSNDNCTSAALALNRDATCETLELSCFMHTEAISIFFDVSKNQDDKVTLASCGILYNLALVYHAIGIQNNSTGMIKKALIQYERAYNLVLSRGDMPFSGGCSRNKEDEELYFLPYRLGMAILNNTGQIYYEILNDNNRSSMFFDALIELASNINFTSLQEENNSKKKKNKRSLTSTVLNERQNFIMNAYVFKRYPHAKAA